MEKRQIMRQWVKALKSGEYTQARRALKNKNCGSFCCLGVLCDIVAKAYKKRVLAYRMPWKEFVEVLYIVRATP